MLMMGDRVTFTTRRKPPAGDLVQAGTIVGFNETQTVAMVANEGVKITSVVAVEKLTKVDA